MGHKIKWTREAIIERFNNPPPEVADRLACKLWMNAGYSGMVSRVFVVFGSWNNLLLSQNIRPRRIKWTKRAIKKQFNNPSPEVKDCRNAGQWRRAGFSGMLCQIRRKYGGWHAFLSKMEIQPMKHPGKVKSKWKKEAVVATFNNPPAEIKNRCNYAEWQRLGYKGMIRSIYSMYDNWYAFLSDQKELPFPKIKWTDSLIVTTIANPPKQIFAPFSCGQWKKAGYAGMLTAIYRRFGNWQSFVKEQYSFKSRLINGKIGYSDWQKVYEIVPQLRMSIDFNGSNIKEEMIIELFAEVKRGNLAAREILIEINKPMVFHILFEIIRKHDLQLDKFEIEELVQVGTHGTHYPVINMGLGRAIELFDPNMDYKFSSYAYPSIKNALLNGLKIHYRKGKLVSLDQKVKDTKNEKTEDSLVDILPNDDDFKRQIDLKFDSDVIKEKINQLNTTKRNKQIVLRRLQGETLEIIGVSYGISRERVRQIVENFAPTIINFFR